MPRLKFGSAQVLAIFCLLLPPLALLAAKAVVVLLIAAYLALAAALWREGRRLALPDPWSCTFLALLIGWCLVASAWSFVPVDAALRALRVGFVMAIGLLFVRQVWETPPQAAGRALWWLWLGILLAIALIIEELLFGHPLLIALKGDAADDYLEMSRLNRGASALAMLIWLATAGLILQERKGLALAGLVAAGALLPFLESSAAMLAFVLATLILLLSFLSRAGARLVLLLGVIVLLFATPGLAKLLDGAGLAEVRDLQVTARERVYVWNFTADRIFEKPLFGWGFNASRDIPNQGVAPFHPGLGKSKAKKKRAPAQPRTSVMPHHPHNAGLQILLELGLVGAAAAGALLWLFLRRLERLPARTLPWASASVLATMAVAGTAYGIWQNQWLALIAANAAMVALLGAAARPAAKQPPPPGTGP